MEVIRHRMRRDKNDSAEEKEERNEEQIVDTIPIIKKKKDTEQRNGVIEKNTCKEQEVE